MGSDARRCKDSYLSKPGTCKSAGYGVVCKVRYNKTENFKTQAACKKIQSETIQRRMKKKKVVKCHMERNDSCSNESDASLCKGSYLSKPGTCKSAGYGVVCKVRHNITENFKTQAACKKKQSETIQRRMKKKCPMAKCRAPKCPEGQKAVQDRTKGPDGCLIKLCKFDCK